MVVEASNLVNRNVDTFLQFVEASFGGNCVYYAEARGLEMGLSRNEQKSLTWFLPRSQAEEALANLRNILVLTE